MWQQHLLCASCGILCRGTDELLSTGRRIRPSLRRSSNYCTKQQAENGRDRALIQYLNGQGVLMTPCRFYFGCYIDTLCGRTLRNRMSGAAARHFFFLEKVRTVSACIGINLPLKKRPADGGEQPTPPWAALAQASHFDVKILLAGVNPSPPCRPRAGTSRQHCRKVSAKTGFGSLPNPITADCPKALQTTLSKAVDAENRVR